jgi:hypothetical protein
LHGNQTPEMVRLKYYTFTRVDKTLYYYPTLIYKPKISQPKAFQINLVNKLIKPNLERQFQPKISAPKIEFENELNTKNN